LKIKKITLIFFLLLLSISFSLSVDAATLIWSDNFDNRAISPPPSGTWDIKQNFSGEPSPLTWPRWFFAPGGPTGSGYYFSDNTTTYGGDKSWQSTFIEWRKFGYWYTNELYVSYWVRYVDYTTNGNNEFGNNKLYYPALGTGVGYVHLGMVSPIELYLSAKDNSGNWITQGNYIPIPNGGVSDLGWHKFEFYINMATGAVWGKWDDVTFYSANYGSWPWASNYVRVITIGSGWSGCCPEPTPFTRHLDNFEVWDGLSDINISYPPPTNRLIPNSPTNISIK
jgi:hypothetical protein